MKIFIGMVNIASLMDDFADGFRDLGHEVFTVVTSVTPIRSSNVDLNIPFLMEKKFHRTPNPPQELIEKYHEKLLNLAWEKALEADVCMFLWNTFKPDVSDLQVLKKLGKKIIICFCGSEVRDNGITLQASKFYGQPFKYRDDLDVGAFERKLRYLRMCEKFADMTICSSDMSLRPGHVPSHLIFNTKPFECKKEQKLYPTLLHAPSSVESKGTSLWMEAFHILRNSGLKFASKVVQGLPREEMPNEYAKADIFCNSLKIGGRSTWEAMAASCVVIERKPLDVFEKCKIYFEDNMTGMGLEPTEDNYQLWLKGMGMDRLEKAQQSIVHATEETVVEELAKLILDYPRRQKLSKDSYEVVQHMTPVKACQSILDYLENPESVASKLSTATAPFLVKYFDPSGFSKEKIDLLSKYERIVKYEKWYKDYIIPVKKRKKGT